MVPPDAFDEDEDLFNFAELTDDGTVGTSDAIDIDEFLAAVETDDAPAQAQDAMDAALDLPELDPSGDLLEPGAPLPSGSRAAGAPTLEGVDADFGGHPAGAGGNVVYTTSRGVPKVIWIGAGALAVLNLLAVLVAWQGQQSNNSKLNEVRDELSEVARDVRDDVERQVQNIQRATTPLVVPAGLPAGSFERIDEALVRRDFAAARRMLYQALSLADALDDAAREDLEAQASFLLADTFRLEASYRDEEQVQ